MAVGHTHPNLYVGNGVTYDFMKVIASAMLDVMIKEEGAKIYRALPISTTWCHTRTGCSSPLWLELCVSQE